MCAFARPQISIRSHESIRIDSPGESIRIANRPPLLEVKAKALNPRGQDQGHKFVSSRPRPVLEDYITAKQEPNCAYGLMFANWDEWIKRPISKLILLTPIKWSHIVEQTTCGSVHEILLYLRNIV